MALPDSATEFLALQAERVRRLPRRQRIVFPEGNDPRVREAAQRLRSESLVEPVLITDAAADPRLGRYADLLHERRRAKGMTRMEAGELAMLPLYQGCLMVAAGDADGFVGGAANSTADTVRAALHSIGALPKVKTVSTFMLLCVRDRSFGRHGVLTIADPAMVIDPSPSELADITIATAASTRALFGIEPVVAMLSFSTKGSGKHKKSDTVVEAFRIVRARAPELHVDAELQADAALVEAVGRSKAPGSTVAGRANTLIFPDINAANIGYKLVERLGGAAAIGPFLQGLARPANDLSRGCSANDIYGVALVTALQADQG
ncbi:MAG: phosphate acyltransferase [Bryobacteraceae bacterium]